MPGAMILINAIYTAISQDGFPAGSSKIFEIFATIVVSFVASFSVFYLPTTIALLITGWIFSIVIWIGFYEFDQVLVAPAFGLAVITGIEFALLVKDRAKSGRKIFLRQSKWKNGSVPQIWYGHWPPVCIAIADYLAWLPAVATSENTIVAVIEEIKPVDAPIGTFTIQHQNGNREQKQLYLMQIRASDKVGILAR